MEEIPLNGGEGVGERNLPQALALLKGGMADSGHRIGNGERCQAVASPESLTANYCDGVWNFNVC